MGLIEELKNTDYIIASESKGFLMVLTPKYVIRLFGSELTEIADRSEFDGMNNKVLLSVKGVPSSLLQLSNLLRSIDEDY